MTQHPPGPPWRATTVAIGDPGDLTTYLPPTGGSAWLRRGDGMVGIGEVARFEGGSVEAADQWWRTVCARIEHDSALPDGGGTGPIAFASFVFDPGHTADRSVVILPRLVVGRRKGVSWLTVIAGTR